MKIAISAMEPHLESDLEPRFGRRPYFLLVEPETMQFETIQNPNTEQTSGAGIATAELLCKAGAGAVITGMIGPKASRALSAAGVRMMTGAEGKVRDAINRYKAGALAEGPGETRGMGAGGGMGRGMRCGQGKGMGAGAGRGRAAGSRGWRTSPWASSAEIESQAPSELAVLKEQENKLAGELDDIRKRIRKIQP